MRCVIALVAVASVFASARAEEPEDGFEVKTWELIAGGAAIGFVSDNTMDVMGCGLGVLSEGSDLKEAMGDIEKALKFDNISYLQPAIQEIEKAINGMKDAKASCMVPVNDVKKIITEIKKHKGLKALILHIAHNMLYDGEKIFAELAGAEHDYKDGSFLTSGQQLGMAMRRTLVGEAAPNPPNSTPPVPPPFNLKTLEAIMAGVAVGFVSDTGDLVTCGIDALPVIGDLKDTVVDLIEGLMAKNWTEIAEALDKAADTIRAIGTAKASCKLAIMDVKSIIIEVKKHKGLNLLMHIAHNFVYDGENIFGEFSKAEQSYMTADFLDTGRQLGMALRRSLVGEVAPPHNPTPSPAPPSPPAPHSAKCKDNPGCDDLSGNCCPADDGTMLNCCGSVPVVHV